jgi:MFS superfamily sulfate permease-like transporter
MLPEAVAYAAIAVYRPSAPLFFANADASLRLVAKNCAALPERTVIVLSLEQSDDLDSSASISNSWIR